MDHDAAPHAPVAAGLLLFRGEPWREFLLMRHHDRWDLPKGHVEPGESWRDAALRETQEETGIDPSRIEVQPDFRYELYYPVRSRQTGDWVEKQLVIYLAQVDGQVPIAVSSEHIGYQWFPWPAEHSIQLQTVDRLLDAVAAWQQSAR